MTKPRKRIKVKWFWSDVKAAAVIFFFVGFFLGMWVCGHAA